MPQFIGMRTVRNTQYFLTFLSICVVHFCVIYQSLSFIGFYFLPQKSEQSIRSAATLVLDAQTSLSGSQMSDNKFQKTGNRFINVPLRVFNFNFGAKSVDFFSSFQFLVTDKENLSKHCWSFFHNLLRRKKNQADLFNAIWSGLAAGNILFFNQSDVLRFVFTKVHSKVDSKNSFSGNSVYCVLTFNSLLIFLKLRNCEKATKFEKKGFPLVLALLSNIKTKRKILSNFCSLLTIS